jgi:hypothetical protein
MAKNLIKAMATLHERRAHFKAKPERVKEIIAFGSEKARAVAKETMDQVRGGSKIKTYPFMKRANLLAHALRSRSD